MTSALSRRALLAAAALPAMAATPALEARADDGGRLHVVNRGATAVRLRGAVAVDGFDGRAWSEVETEMNLVPACSADGVVRPVGTVMLGAGQTLAPPPWLGWSCSGQCEHTCRSNAYWGSGPFRFRLAQAGTGAAILSNPFQMSASASRSP